MLDWLRRIKASLFNSRSGRACQSIRIEKSAWISKTAIIGGSSDEFYLGGEIRIGERVRVSHGSIIDAYGGKIEIGRNVFIGPYCTIYGHGGLRIGDDVMIAAGTVIIPANHGFSDLASCMNVQPVSTKGIFIENNVWIGAQSTILDGASLSQGCIVAAGAVVRGRVEQNWIVAGVPARKIGERGGAD